MRIKASPINQHLDNHLTPAGRRKKAAQTHLMKNKRASKVSTGTGPDAAQHKHNATAAKAIIYTATRGPVLMAKLFFYFFIFKWFVMSVSFFPSRRRRPWVSHIIVGCYGDMLVYAVYRTPVVRGVPMLHLSWLHKIVPAL